jgi:hypothetical protein
VVSAVTVTTQEQITRELARMRMRLPDESPEAKALDIEATHGRINRLLDRLDYEQSKVPHATHQ